MQTLTVHQSNLETLKAYALECFKKTGAKYIINTSEVGTAIRNLSKQDYSELTMYIWSL